MKKPNARIRYVLLRCDTPCKSEINKSVAGGGGGGVALSTYTVGTYPVGRAPRTEDMVRDGANTPGLRKPRALAAAGSHR